MVTKPYDTKSVKMNRESFDKWEFSEYVEQLIQSVGGNAHYFTNDISYKESKDQKLAFIQCNFSWAYDYKDVSDYKFRDVADEIEDIISDALNIDRAEVYVHRYDGFYTGYGYDVCVDLFLCYDIG